jgi:septum formation topological specificity factor MinE
MPRPPNYITKIRKLAKTTDGDPLLKLSLLHVIQRYVEGEAKLEELNKIIDKYSKTISKSEDVITINIELPQSDFLED